jgi:hypothetical protein
MKFQKNYGVSHVQSCMYVCILQTISMIFKKTGVMFRHGGKAHKEVQERHNSRIVWSGNAFGCLGDKIRRKSFLARYFNLDDTKRNLIVLGTHPQQVCRAAKEVMAAVQQGQLDKDKILKAARNKYADEKNKESHDEHGSSSNKSHRNTKRSRDDRDDDTGETRPTNGHGHDQDQPSSSRQRTRTSASSATSANGDGDGDGLYRCPFKKRLVFKYMPPDEYRHFHGNLQGRGGWKVKYLQRHTQCSLSFDQINKLVTIRAHDPQILQAGYQRVCEEIQNIRASYLDQQNNQHQNHPNHNPPHAGQQLLRRHEREDHEHEPGPDRRHPHEPHQREGPSSSSQSWGSQSHQNNNNNHRHDNDNGHNHDQRDDYNGHYGDRRHHNNYEHENENESTHRDDYYGNSDRQRQRHHSDNYNRDRDRGHGENEDYVRTRREHQPRHHNVTSSEHENYRPREQRQQQEGHSSYHERRTNDNHNPRSRY